MKSSSFELSLLKIPVSDVSRSAEFYRQGMGWSQKFVMSEYGWAQFEAGSLSIALYVPGMGGGSRPPGASLDFQLAVVDLATLKGQLLDYSSDLGIGIFKNDDGSETLEFSDPDGNEWKIAKSQTPSE